MNGYQGSPTLARLISDMVEGRLLELWAPFPGKVVSYDASTQTATIRPGIKLPIQQDEAGSYPEELVIPDLDEVPVRMPLAGGGWRIATSLQAGDLVMVHVTFRALDGWLAGSGDAVRVVPGRHHDINDCWAEPWDHNEATTDNLVLTGHGITVELTTFGQTVVHSGGATSGVIVDGAASSLHTALQTSLTEITGLLAGLGLLAPSTTGTLIPALAAKTWVSGKLEAEK